METNNLPSAKAAMLILVLLTGIISASKASSTASFSGNWSSLSTWAGNMPGFNVGSGNDIIIPAGVTVLLDSDLTIQGVLHLEGGILDLNGMDLTINGGIVTSGLGVVIGNVNSNVAFSGFGGAGNLVFASGSQTINNMTVNIGSGGGIALESDLTINGALTLLNGTLGIQNNNLTISGKGFIHGGSSTSYVMTTGTGSVIIPRVMSGPAFVFHVGTQNNYAPVAITNNSGSSASFSVTAYEGVLADGNTGNDICAEQSIVNTSWNISSSITDNINVDLELFWNSNMQLNGFNNTQAYISEYSAKGWSTLQPATATVNTNNTFSLKLAGVTALSQFAVFGKNSATGINNIPTNASFSLYPNPANSFINVSLAQITNFSILKVYDVQGNEVISQQVENSVTSLDINKLNSGVYFASLNGAVAKKFIKE